MFIDYKYAYFIGALITVLIWLVLFIRRKDLRREMMLLSLATLALGPSNILYYGEYWRPEFVLDIGNFGIESLIVCFTYGGICGVIYEYLFKKTAYRIKSINLQLSKVQMLVSLTLGINIFIALEVLTNLNVIYTSSTGLLIAGLLFLFFRRDLLVPSFASAIISLIISVLIYWFLLLLFPEFFDRFWIPDTISNIRLLLIPVEEYYFHFALGLCLGVMYEIGYAEVDKPMKKRFSKR